MLNKISGFLFMATEKGSVNEATTTGTLNTCTLTLFSGK